MLSIGISSAWAQPAEVTETTPAENAIWQTSIDVDAGLWVTNSLAALVPLPVSILADFFVVGLETDLKTTPAVFFPPANTTLDSGGCLAVINMPPPVYRYENFAGIVTTRGNISVDYGDLGNTFTNHFNSLVEIEVKGDRVPAYGGLMALRPGVHEFKWTAKTLYSPVVDTYVPLAMIPIIEAASFGFGSLVKTKYGQKIVAYLNKGANWLLGPPAAKASSLAWKKTAILTAAKLGIKFSSPIARVDHQKVNGDPPDLQARAVNRATQRVTFKDAHAPEISTTFPTRTLEATTIGGSPFAANEDLLKLGLDYADPCGNQVWLSHDAPLLFPVGEETTIEWRVTDVAPGQNPAVIYRNGVPSFATVEQVITVEDTQAPIIIAPEALSIESPTPVTTAPLDLGKPLVVDLADAMPQISNDAPGVVDPDTRVGISWTATDASNNSDSRVQWLSVKSPGTNTAPEVDDVHTATITAEPVSIRLDGFDPDVLPGSFAGGNLEIRDQLNFDIVNPPENGKFVAPLNPYFIEDFRVSFQGQTDEHGESVPHPLEALLGEDFDDFLITGDPDEFLSLKICQEEEEIPLNFIFNPTYVHVSDEGRYYVRDQRFQCQSDHDVVRSDRISLWSPDREFLNEYTLDLVPSEIQNLYVGAGSFEVDREGNIWWEFFWTGPTTGQFWVISMAKITPDLTSAAFENVTMGLSEQGGGRYFSAMHASQDNGLLYVHDNRGIMVYKIGEDNSPPSEVLDFVNTPRLNINGDVCPFPGNPPTSLFGHPCDGSATNVVDFGFPWNDECSADQPQRRWFMVTDSAGDLYVSEGCGDRVHKWKASGIDESGDIVTGDYVGWMGRCSANIGQFSGCDEERQVSRGFACTDLTCEREIDPEVIEDDGTSGTEPSQFYKPSHMVVDPLDNIYVADFGNSRVQRLGVDGTFAGQAVSTGSGINQGGSPGFILGNFGRPQLVSANSDTLFVMDLEEGTDNFLHVFKALPFHKICSNDSASGCEQDVEGDLTDDDGDGYVDNSTIVKYVSNFNFPGALGSPTGEDEFVFKVNDGLEDSDSATVTIGVERNYRPPANLALHCFDTADRITSVDCELDEDTGIFLELFATDADGIIGIDGLDTLSYDPIQPGLGTLELIETDRGTAFYRYTPRPNEYGTDYLSFAVDDSVFEVASPEFPLLIRPVADKPELILRVNPEVGRGFPVSLSAEYIDPDSDPTESTPTAMIDWGDGTQEAGVVTPTWPGAGLVEGTHVYDLVPASAVLEICLTHEPDDQGTDTTCESATLTFIEAASLQVDIIADNTEPERNETVTFSIPLTNVMPQGWPGLDALNASAVVEIPSRLQLETASPECILSRVASVNVLECSVASLSPGQEVEFGFTATVKGNVRPRPFITVEVDASHDDPGYPADPTAFEELLIVWPDRDEDFMPTDWELFYSLDPDVPGIEDDSDGDGLKDIEEYVFDTDPGDSDTDGDQLSDGDEVNKFGSDPLSRDTDEDGQPDNWENKHGLNLLLPTDAQEDADDDGLSNLEEYRRGTDPNNRDTDGDGVIDSEDFFPNDPRHSEPEDYPAIPAGTPVLSWALMLMILLSGRMFLRRRPDLS